MRPYLALLLLPLMLLLLTGCPPPPEVAQGTPPPAEAPPAEAPPAAEPAPAPAAESAPAADIAWMTSLEDALEMAQTEKKPVLVDFHAVWCGPCKMLDSSTFSDDEVKRAMAAFIPVKVDIDEQPSLANKHQVRSVPTVMVLKADGSQVTHNLGFIEAPAMVQFLKRAEAQAK